ncbi:endonuclease/exonuclease/phosphatase family protein [Nitrospira sp. Nam80]
MNITTCTLIAVAVLCLATVPATLALEQDAPRRPLRFVTLNILHDGPTSGFLNNGTRLEERMDLVIRELHRFDPDVVALQEASHSRRHGDVAQRMADGLGFHKVFAPATERIFSIPIIDKLIVDAMGFKEGPAILSRFPITASYVYDPLAVDRVLSPAFSFVPISRRPTDRSTSSLPTRHEATNAKLSGLLGSCGNTVCRVIRY